MSTKVKGLEYQAEQPAFLQRMRQGVPGAGEKHERPIPRPKRTKDDDDEDAPAYVMEDTNESVSKEDFDKLVKDGKDDEATVPKPESGNEDREASVENPIMSGALPDENEKADKERQKPKEASVGQRKRKAATAVGQDDDEDGSAEGAPKAPVAKKGKKKSKPIKLAFDDDEG